MSALLSPGVTWKEHEKPQGQTGREKAHGGTVTVTILPQEHTLSGKMVVL